MTNFSTSELEEGLKAMESLVNKSMKAQETLTPGTSQWTTLSRRLKAFKMAYTIISDKLNEQVEKR